MKTLEQKESAINKATAKVMVLQFEIEDYKRDLKGGNGNGALTHEQIELCLRSAERELDIWNYILKVLENERD
jgi:FtsZ-binding cell division protein ZapB